MHFLYKYSFVQEISRKKQVKRCILLPLPFRTSYLFISVFFLLSLVAASIPSSRTIPLSAAVPFLPCWAPACLLSHVLVLQLSSEVPAKVVQLCRAGRGAGVTGSWTPRSRLPYLLLENIFSGLDSSDAKIQVSTEP